ncbi:urea transporter [Branchiibius hedensis]|uniref:Urea transporter n=1 Tax=Branchiibius hedensis TaxID=672460 RepID=A0A2Y9A265_9MICO|nr:urea transporter [Branchiibius hedensis]PWJ27487.1 urea transporter [Branchiibius hedensis]SSA36297.1 urea transporter [Branchiibius hedensis]
MALTVAQDWDRLAKDNGGIGFVDTLLRGAGQVMFQDNPVTGLLFLVGITWGALAADQWEVAVGSVVALLIATITAKLLAVDQTAVRQGLYGFNGILVGAAVPTFLGTNSYMWVYLIVGAAVSTVVMMAIANIGATWGVPALTFPFVLTTWFLVLGAWSFNHIKPVALGPTGFPVAIDNNAAHVAVSASMLAETLFRNVAQVFLINNVVTGVIFVIALAVSSRWSAAFALLGSALAIATALVLGASGSGISNGLYGFSAVLTAIALGSIFYTPGWRVLAFTVLGTIFTVIIQGALNAALSPVGIPTFTAPFVFATWLFLLPKEKFMPIPHAPIAHDAVSTKTTSGASS